MSCGIQQLARALNTRVSYKAYSRFYINVKKTSQFIT